MKRKTKNTIKFLALGTGVAFAAAYKLAELKRPDSVFDDDPEQKNPLEGKKVIFIHDANDKENADGEKGHLEAVGTAVPVKSFYQQYIKRGIDLLLSFAVLPDCSKPF